MLPFRFVLFSALDLVKILHIQTWDLKRNVKQYYAKIQAENILFTSHLIVLVEKYAKQNGKKIWLAYSSFINIENIKN